ncbi:hypothetical protein LRP88_05646 [Fusarium phalaenopsidis]
MAKIFLTGASGYIGGDLLHLLSKSHPHYRIRVLVRDAAKGEAIKRSFGQVQIVNGGLDDTELIAREAVGADVVVHLAATSHLKIVQTIHQALSGKASGEKSQYWIQISGASVLAMPELANLSRSSGSTGDNVYDDLSGIESIQSLIRQHLSRVVDNYILSVASDTPYIKMAVMIPPIIYS